MHKRLLLDTSVLIAYWRQRVGDTLANRNATEVRQWAQTLIKVHGTNAVATPVVVEFLAGVRSSHELTLARAYLGEFEAVDRGRIIAQDWEEAKRRAQRVPSDGKPRQLGDCLIKAVADRLKYEVFTLDESFPL